MKQPIPKVIDELCDYLGYDLDSPMCKELREHIQKNPDLQTYIDSIRMTVKLCKDCHPQVKAPEAVKAQLLEKLKNCEKSEKKKSI